MVYLHKMFEALTLIGLVSKHIVYCFINTQTSQVILLFSYDVMQKYMLILKMLFASL